MRKRVTMIGVYFICFVAFSVEINLLKNPSFEKINSKGAPLCWKPSGKAEVSITRKAFHGANALKIEMERGDNSKYAFFTFRQRVLLTKSQKYNLNFYAKIQGDGKVLATWSFLDANNELIKVRRFWLSKQITSAKNPDWQKLGEEIKAPEKAESVIISLCYRLYQDDKKGVAYFDDVSFTPLDQASNGMRAIRRTAMKSRRDFSIIQIGRAAFLQKEKNPSIHFEIRNHSTHQLDAVKASIKYPTIKSIEKSELFIKKIDANTNKTIALPIETRLKPSKYKLKLIVVAVINGREIKRTKSFSITIVGKRICGMPVVMAGFGDMSGLSDIEELIKIGFTHQRKCTMYNIAANKKKLIASKIAQLDCRLEKGLYLISYFALLQGKNIIKKYPRLNRKGKSYKRASVEASNPELQALAVIWAKRMGKLFGNHPAWAGSLIHSEIRDTTNPSFNRYEPEAFKKFAGFNIPAEVNGKLAPNYRRIKGFPASRIIPNDMPLLVYYRWFWTVGDGVNVINRKISDALHNKIHRPFFTSTDPAVRVPPIWGSGAGLDRISHWTYVNPHPIRIGAVVDELRAMSKGSPGQEIASMIQMFCYREATAPIKEKVSKPPSWLKKKPKAPYIMVPPDLMQEAVWIEISRRLDAILFFGYSSFIKDTTYGEGGYTSAASKNRLKMLIQNIIKPFGAVLKRIPERSPRVAILQSFTSSVFAGRGTWGWTHWPFHMHQILQWAHLEPSVIYEEEILKNGFGDIQVLVMPHCDVLTKPVFEAITAFQRKGGILICDEYAPPEISPDIYIDEYDLYWFCRNQDKSNMQKAGERIRKQLEPFYRPYINSSNNDLIVRVRSFKNADYLFVINDKRGFGNYIGQYKKVMEKGLPNKGKVSVNRIAGAVYNLVMHKKVEFEVSNNSTIINTEFTTNDGKLLLLLPKPIKRVNVVVSPKGIRGQRFNAKVEILDIDEKVVQALLPVQLTIYDNEGNIAAGSGFYCAVNGVLNVDILVPLNYKSGEWIVEVRELAGNKSDRTRILIE